MKRHLVLAALLSFATPSLAAPDSDWNKLVTKSKQLVALSKTRRVAPKTLYSCKVVVILNDHFTTTTTVNARVEAARNGVAFSPLWIKDIAKARHQINRVRSISPVPNSLYDADRKIVGYALMMDEYLDACKDFLYSRDSTMLQIRQEAVLSVASGSLKSALREISAVVSQTPAPPLPKPIRPKVYTNN